MADNENVQSVLPECCHGIITRHALNAEMSRKEKTNVCSQGKNQSTLYVQALQKLDEPTPCKSTSAPSVDSSDQKL